VVIANAISVSISINDLGTLAIAIFGVLIGLIYIVTEASEEDNPNFEEFKIEIQKSMHIQGIDFAMQDYESSVKEVERRENIDLVVGTILITASLLVLGNTATAGISYKFPYAMVSIFVFVAWLYVLHFTTKWLDSIAYSRIRAIEEAISSYSTYNFGIHKYMFKRTHKGKQIVRRLQIRRFFWGFIIIILSVAWLLLSIISVQIS
jgi:hypothetical protein